MATVNGTPSSESLTGSTGDDLISGLRGDDTRVDGLVTDRLNGDGGADQYFLKRALDGAANIDAFADLESGVDAVAC